MIVTATRAGLAAARRQPRIALTLWLLNLLLALAVGLPATLTLRSAIGRLPEADALREGFSVGIVRDLVELQPGLLDGLLWGAAGLAGLGLVVGAAATGGVLEVLLRGAGRPFAASFGAGALSYFGRFVRAGLTAALVAAVAGAVVAGPLVALGRRLRQESGSEALALSVTVGGWFVAALVVLVALLALDAARIRIVRDDLRRVVPLVLRSVGLVLRHPVKWLGTWGVNALILLSALLLLLAFRNTVPAGTWPLIVLMFAAQQAFQWTRCCLRVALLGSEIALVERLRPVVVEVAPGLAGAAAWQEIEALPREEPAQ